MVEEEGQRAVSREVLKGEEENVEEEEVEKLGEEGGWLMMRWRTRSV